MQFNAVLLRACAHEPAERYANAEELHDDLMRLRDGRPLAARVRRRWPVLAGVGAAAVLAGAGWHFAAVGAQRGSVLIETEPPGAMVVGEGQLRPAPAQFGELTVGAHSAHVMLKGFEPVDVKFDVAAGGEAHPATLRLTRGLGAAEISSLPAGAAYELRQGDAVVKTGTTPAARSAPARRAAAALDMRPSVNPRAPPELSPFSPPHRPAAARTPRPLAATKFPPHPARA